MRRASSFNAVFAWLLCATARASAEPAPDVHERSNALFAEGKRLLSGVSFGQVSQPYPGEYARLEPDRALLERAALTTGGRLNPPVESLFDPAGQVVTYQEPLWQRFILLAIGCFLLDLLMRRVSIFDRGFQRQARRAA